ncbi:MAG: Integral rane sensor signal transduction histidine kinase, partial [Pedosphaera sp.]|nr:Integral rane sensor signal transduction histidine kinase [Pedosphaera sp.]
EMVAENSPASGPSKVVGAYALTSANDFQQRDPQDCRLLGSNDGGKTWTTLDQRSGEIFSERHQRRIFELAITNAFNAYRLQIDRVRKPESANSVQLAEIELMGRSPEDTSPTPIYLDKITVQGDNPPLESVDHAFDGQVETKWLDAPKGRATCASWVQWQYEAPSNAVVTSFARLHDLRVRAKEGYPVRLEAVVAGKIAGSSRVEMLDDSGFLDMDGPPELFQLVPGQHVLVEGVTIWNDGRVGIGHGRVQVRTPAAAISPAHFSLEQPLAKGADFLWAETEGTIQFKQQIGGQVFFDLQDGNDSMSVSMPEVGVARTLPDFGRWVRVTGICRGGFNDQGVWVAASLRATSVEESPMTEKKSGGESSVRLGTFQNTGPNAAGITKIAQIRQMSLAEWRRRPTVTIRGVVTSLIGVYLQDDSAGVQVVVKTADSSKLVGLGEYVEITGPVGVSDAATPLITADKVVCIGRGKLPHPQHPPWGQLASGRTDSQWVEMDGVVQATDGAHLLLSCDGRPVTASFGAAAASAVNQLVDAAVRIRGVGIASLDDWGRMQGVHLLSPSLEYLEVEQAPTVPFSQPVQPIADIMKVSGPVDPSHRIRVEGVLTLQDGQKLFLQDDTGSVMAIYKQDVVLDSIFGRSQWSFWRTSGSKEPSRNTPHFSPGDRLEVVGFRDTHGYSPVLTEVLARKIGTGQMKIEELKTDSFTDWKRDSTLVRIDGELTGQQLMGSHLVLQVVSYGRTLQVFLPANIRQALDIMPGSRLRLAGVWQMDPVQYSELGRSVGGIRLLPRSLDDVVVLSRPSWWTVRHALTVIGGLTFVLLAASVWITQLRRKVEQRTTQLAGEIHLREQVEQQRVLEAERTRIARDLHDDLGAALTQIRFLSAVESRDEAVPEETRNQLREVSEKSHQLVTSLDEIVWAINPANDLLPKLIHYLCHVAEEFFRPTSIRCRMEVDESLPEVPLTSEVRHNLFLAVREAMNNIAKHSQATEVWFRIQKQENNMAITLEDNGRGFVATDAAVGEGLQNMRRRVEEIGGQFECESKTGQGTTCRIRLRFDATVRHNQPV